MALATTGAQLERVCRKFRRVLDVDENGDRLDERRYVRDEVLPSGMVRISAVLHADEAALVLKAIEGARREGAAKDIPAATSVGEQEPRQLLPMADALVKVAESFLADGERAGNGGERTQIIVHLDQDVLAGDGALAATLDDGSRFSAETFRRVACDAGLVPVVHGAGGETLDVGRRTRTIPPALRRALWARDGGCRFPGCTNRLYVHAHHIEHWVHGGPTSTENLVLLCSAHHRLLHEGGFTVGRTGVDELVFRDGRGRIVDEHPAPASVRNWVLDVMAAWNAAQEIDEETNFPGWDGSPVDYDATVSALLD